jgi:anti-anti-sigma factor
MTDSAPHDDFRIEHRPREDGATVVSVFGEVDLFTAPEVETALASLARQKRTAVLDLTAVEFMDSTGLNLIIRMAQEAARDGWSFALAEAMSDTVQRLFEITGVRGRLPFDAEP